MKKYHRKRITIRTREIFSVSKAAGNDIQNSICPFCHAPLFLTNVTHQSFQSECAAGEPIAKEIAKHICAETRIEQIRTKNDGDNL